jgi:hypothetical protein
MVASAPDIARIKLILLFSRIDSVASSKLSAAFVDWNRQRESSRKFCREVCQLQVNWLDRWNLRDNTGGRKGGRRSVIPQAPPLLRQRKPYLTGSPPSRQERRYRPDVECSEYNPGSGRFVQADYGVVCVLKNWQQPPFRSDTFRRWAAAGIFPTRASSSGQDCKASGLRLWLLSCDAFR